MFTGEEQAMGKTKGPGARRRGSQGGFTMMEIVLALMVFMMMTLVFAAVFPLALRGAQFSNNYSQAALLAQHKIDQLRAAGFSKMDYADLNSLGIVDAMATPPTGLPATYAFTNADSLVSNGASQGFFPPGSSGALSIVDGSALNATVPVGQVDDVTVTVTWSGAGISSGSYRASAMIVKMSHR